MEANKLLLGAAAAVGGVALFRSPQGKQILEGFVGWLTKGGGKEAITAARGQAANFVGTAKTQLSGGNAGTVATFLKDTGTSTAQSGVVSMLGKAFTHHKAATITAAGGGAAIAASSDDAQDPKVEAASAGRGV